MLSWTILLTWLFRFQPPWTNLPFMEGLEVVRAKQELHSFLATVPQQVVHPLNFMRPGDTAVL